MEKVSNHLLRDHKNMSQHFRDFKAYRDEEKETENYDSGNMPVKNDAEDEDKMPIIKHQGHLDPFNNRQI